MAEKFSITGKVVLTQPDNLNDIAKIIKKKLQVSVPVKLTGATAAANDAARKVKTAFSTVSIPLTFNAVRNSAKATRELKKAMGNVDIPIKVNITNLQDIKKQISQQIGGQVIPVQIQLKNGSNSGIKNISRSMKQTADNTKEASDRMGEFGRQTALTIRRFGAYTLVTAGFFELTQALSEGVKEAFEFDAGLTKIRQVTGRSIAGLRGLTNEIDSLSTSLGVSSKELLDASQVLAQAGFSANETSIALETLAKSDLSPTFDSIEETVEGSIAVLRQFNLDATKLEATMGSLNAVSAAYAVESSDLIKGIRTAGGAFQAAGGSAEEFFGLFTSVRSTTRASADSIATGLKTISTRLQRGSTQSFLRELGIDLKFTGEEARKLGKEGTFVGVYEAIRRINDAIQTMGSNDPRFAQIAEELGGFRQIDKVIPLLQQFELAEKARGVAIRGTDSLTQDAIIGQESLANQIKKVREELQQMLRALTQDETFRSFISVSLDLARAFIRVGEALGTMLAPLTLLTAGALASPLRKFRADFTDTLFGRTKVPMFAKGGSVPGTGNKDDVPAVLTPGEFVIRKDAVKKIGVTNLQRLNSGQVRGFAKGGLVGDVASNPITAGIALFTFQQFEEDLGEFGDNLKTVSSGLLTFGAQFLIFNGLLNSANPALTKLREGIDSLAQEVVQSKSTINKTVGEVRGLRARRKDILSSGVMTQAQAKEVGDIDFALNRKSDRIKQNRDLMRTNRDQIKINRKSASSMEALNKGIAVGIASLSTFSGWLDSYSSKQLDELRANGGSVSGSSRIAFAGSKAASSAITGGVLGSLGAAQLAPLLGLGPVGVGVATGLTALTFAAGSANSALKEFDKEIRSITLDREADKLSNALKAIESGTSTSSLQNNSVVGGVRFLQDQLQNESDPGLRDNVKSSIEASIGGIQSFITETRKSVTSLKEFQNAIPSDVLKFFAKNTGTSLEELTKQIDESIKAQGEYLDSFKKSVLAQQAFETRLRTEIAISKAIKNTSESLVKFNGVLGNLSSGRFNSDISNTLSSQLLDLSGIADVNKFSKDITDLASVFGKSGASLASGTVDAVKAVDALPALFLKLRSSDPLGESGDVLTRIKQELDSMGISDLISEAIINQVRPLLGADDKDANFFAAIREDLAGVVDGVAKGVSGIGSTLETANNRIEKELTSFSSNIADYVDALDGANARRVSTFDTRSTFARIAGGASRTGNLGDQQGILNDRQSFITGGRDSGQVFKDLVAAQSRLLNITNQLNETSNPERQRDLIKAQAEQAIAIRRANEALGFLADASQRTAILQEQLTNERAQREGRNTVAEKLTFGGVDTLQGFSGNLGLARNLVAAGGDITVIPQQLREELKGFLDGLGDTTLGGLGGLSGNDIKELAVNNSLGEAGISREGITEASAKEDKILSDIKAIFEESQRIEMERARMEELAATNLVTKMSSAFDKFVKDLENVLKREQINSINQNIASAQADRNELQRVRSIGSRISQLSGGVDPKTVLSNIDGLSEAFIELAKTSNLVEGLKTNFRGKQTGTKFILNSLASDIGPENPAESLSDDRLEFFQNKILSNLEKSFGSDFAESLKNKIEDGAFNDLDEFSLTEGPANSINRLSRSFTNIILDTLKESEAAEKESKKRFRELSKNVGGGDFAKNILFNKTEILDLRKNLPERVDFNGLDKSIQELTTTIRVLNKTRQGFIAPTRLATGGMVGGIGNTDTVPAMLTPGEFVIRKDAVKKHGVKFLENVNKGRTNFASGGLVQNNEVMSSASLDRFNAAVNQFTMGVDRLNDAIRLIPSHIEMRGQHKLDIIVNGAQVLNNIMPSVAELVKSEINASINRLIKERFPEQGPLL